MLRIYIEDETDAASASYRVYADSVGRHYVDVPDSIMFAKIPETIPREKILRLSYIDNIQTPPKRSRGVYANADKTVEAIIKDLSPRTQAQPGMLGLIIIGYPLLPEATPVSVLADMRDLYQSIMRGNAEEKGLFAVSWENEQAEKSEKGTESLAVNSEKLNAEESI